MRVMVVFSSINKIEDIKETWKKNKNGLKWKYAYNERRLILYNGHKIFDKDYERISNKCNKIINNTDGEILILVHASSKGIKDMFNKINLNSSHISNKKVYTLYSHLYEKEGLIGSLADAIKGNDGSEWKQAFDKLWSSCIKGESQEEINEILRLFLPLDIDMQALQTAKNKESYLNNIYADLEELYNLEKYKDGSIDEHYRRKLFSLWRFFGASLDSNQTPSPKAMELALINNCSKEFCKLAGLSNGNPKESPIYKFLKSLDDKSIVSINDLYKPFNNLKIYDKMITSFPKWYRVLAEELQKQLQG
ncbi:MAG: hypothetical protein KAK00_05990 [Nanoarchaeota archaeon]|nr:hypothetical protein [Nanoarchaeota archaeon]